MYCILSTYVEESCHSVEILREIDFGKIRKLNIKFKKPRRIEGHTVWILNKFLQSTDVARRMQTD